MTHLARTTSSIFRSCYENLTAAIAIVSASLRIYSLNKPASEYVSCTLMISFLALSIIIFCSFFRSDGHNRFMMDQSILFRVASVIFSSSRCGCNLWWIFSYKPFAIFASIVCFFFSMIAFPNCLFKFKCLCLRVLFYENETCLETIFKFGCSYFPISFNFFSLMIFDVDLCIFSTFLIGVFATFSLLSVRPAFC